MKTRRFDSFRKRGQRYDVPIRHWPRQEAVTRMLNYLASEIDLLWEMKNGETQDSAHASLTNSHQKE